MGTVFDRVTYTCRDCKEQGIIREVWLRLTMILLRGECPNCGRASVTMVDLVEIDAWMKE
jgi:predicted RNA-binding Zn-ribbon protein involved in translation (DUF1610 family)